MKAHFKTFMLWLVGTIAGLAICFVLAVNAQSKNPKIAARESYVMKAVKEYISVPGLKSFIDKAKSQADANSSTASGDPHAKPPASNLPFSEELLAELEQSWETLPAQAEASSDLTGWRFTRVQPNSVFARAGFKAGDFIPAENVDQTLASFSSKDHPLAKRTYKILKRIAN